MLQDGKKKKKKKFKVKYFYLGNHIYRSPLSDFFFLYLVIVKRVLIRDMTFLSYIVNHLQMQIRWFLQYF